MEIAANAWAAVRAWWAGLPPLPDPDLPVPSDAALVVVIGTLVGGLGLAAATTGWVEKRVSWAGLFASLVGAGLLYWAWDADRDAGWGLVPGAFVDLLARIIR